MSAAWQSLRSRLRLNRLITGLRVAAAVSALLLAVAVYSCSYANPTIKQTGDKSEATSDTSTVKVAPEAKGNDAKASSDVSMVKAEMKAQADRIIGVNKEVQGSINSRMTGLGQWPQTIMFCAFCAYLCWREWCDVLIAKPKETAGIHPCIVKRRLNAAGGAG